MRIGTAGHDVQTAADQPFGKNLRIANDLFGIATEFRAQCLTKSSRLASDGMHQWPALQTRKDSRINLFAQRLIIRQDDAATTCAQCLVRCRCYDMRMRNRIGMQTSSHQTGDMRHINHQIGTDLVSHLAESCKIKRAGIG